MEEVTKMPPKARRTSSRASRDRTKKQTPESSPRQVHDLSLLEEVPPAAGDPDKTPPEASSLEGLPGEGATGSVTEKTMKRKSDNTDLTPKTGVD